MEGSTEEQQVPTEPKLKHKERNTRPPKDSINILEYDRLLHKMIYKMSKTYGKWVFDYKEELMQEGYIGLIKAHKVYDPTRGTFVTIAYLRVHTEMCHYLNHKAKGFVRMNNLEDVQGKSSPLGGGSFTWEDLFAGNEVDYLAVARLSIDKEDIVSQKLFEGLIMGVRKGSLHKFCGVPRDEIQGRIDELKGLMVAVVEELYGDSSSYK